MLIYKCVVCRPQCTAQGLGSTQSIIAAAIIIILMNPPVLSTVMRERKATDTDGWR